MCVCTVVSLYSAVTVLQDDGKNQERSVVTKERAKWIHAGRCAAVCVRIGWQATRFPVTRSSCDVMTVVNEYEDIDVFVLFCANEIVDGGVRPAPGGFGEKKRKKVYIPVDQYPDINFMGELAFF